VRRGLGLRAADSPDARSPRRLPRLLPRHRRSVAAHSPTARASRSRGHSKGVDARSLTPQRRGTNGKSRCKRRSTRAENNSHHSCPKSRHAEDSPDVHSPRRLPRLLPREHRHTGSARSPSEPASRSRGRGSRADARSVTPQRRGTGSKSRCKRRSTRAANTSHRSCRKLRSHSARKKTHKRRSGSDMSCHPDGHSGSGHARKRTRHRSGGVHGHRGHAGKAESAAAPQQPQLLSQELQERLNRLLEKI